MGPYGPRVRPLGPQRLGRRGEGPAAWRWAQPGRVERPRWFQKAPQDEPRPCSHFSEKEEGTRQEPPPLDPSASRPGPDCPDARGPPALCRDSPPPPCPPPGFRLSRAPHGHLPSLHWTTVTTPALRWPPQPPCERKSPLNLKRLQLTLLPYVQSVTRPPHPSDPSHSWPLSLRVTSTSGAPSLPSPPLLPCHIFFLSKDFLKLFYRLCHYGCPHFPLHPLHPAHPPQSTPPRRCPCPRGPRSGHVPPSLAVFPMKSRSFRKQLTESCCAHDKSHGPFERTAG